MHADQTIDVDGFSNNLDAICRTDLAAIFVCCGTGEFHALSLDEYRTLVMTARDVIAGRKPLLAGVGMGPAQALEFAATAQQLDAGGVLALPPYLITPDPAGLEDYYRQLAESLEISVILYHRANAVLTAATLERLSSVEKVIAVKDGIGDIETLRRHIVTFGDRYGWMSGMPTVEMSFEAFYACGVRSYSSAIANFAPAAALASHEAVVSGNNDRCARMLREFIIPLCGIRDRRPGYAVSYVKAAMNLLGLAAGPVRPPLVELTPHEQQELAEILRANGLPARG